MRGESARPGKRPLRALSAAEKMEAIQRVHDGESKASVARDIGVPESTLRGWCKSEHKIRGMARNSSTPDSEAHSPASSGGANQHMITGASNMSSEDEAVGSSAKKMKLDAMGMTDNGESNEAVAIAAKQLDVTKHQQQAPKMDYVTSLINSLVGNGLRPENNALLLQQLGLISSAQNAATITKSLLSMSSAASHLAGGHLAGSPSQTVGLVENGLQYTKSSSGMHHKRSSSGNNASHISAIAPTSQFDSVSKSRKSLPPAAEAPSTPVPASPRKTNEHQNGVLNAHQQQQQQQHTSTRTTKRDSNGNKKMDNTVLLWLAQQQQQQQLLAGQQFNPSTSGVDGSWFWQWYKQCGFPTPASLTSAMTGVAGGATTPLAKKSPSKAKALLDNVLNNNEAMKRYNYGGTAASEEADIVDIQDMPTTEEAIAYGEKFFSWLDRCSEPSVTRLQIMQIRYLLDNLKTRRKTTTCKQSRK